MLCRYHSHRYSPRDMMTHKLTAYLKWILPFFMIFYPVQIDGVNSFCKADKVPLGGLGSVSCHFSEDLSKVPQKDLNVYLYRLSDSEPELVVFYSWINGQPRIDTKPGYDCTSNLTDHLEILIYNANGEHAGVYKCVVAPSAGLNQKTCTLIIEEERSVVVAQNYTYIVAIVLGSLVLLVAIIIIIIMVFRLRWQRQNNSLRTTEAASESAKFIAERESLQGVTD